MWCYDTYEVGYLLEENSEENVSSSFKNKNNLEAVSSQIHVNL